MSNARKLQTEIERVMKKVDEGVGLFDEIWEKVYSAEQQNQKEKYEMDLKKEIKKLQRLRDQIKTWIGSSDVKDKDPLLEARRLIETKMEQFKICEKETKTKTYSKEGLAREDRLDPEEEAKQNTTTWIRDYIERLQQLVEDVEVEIERLSAGKGKKTNKHKIDEFIQHVSNHKFHLSKLEGIIRLVNNDVLGVDAVDNLKDDLDYYIESYEDEDYRQAYDEDFFYETLGLDELDVVNVDRVTNVEQPKKKPTNDDSVSASSKGSSKGNKATKKSALASVIPITIGRARLSSSGKEKEEKVTPAKIGRASSSTSSSTAPAPSTPAAVSAARVSSTAATVSAVPAAGASMAAILKRETEQQEQERQQQLREQQATAQAEQARQQQLELQRQQQEAQQEQLRQQQAQAAQQEAMKQHQQEALRKQEEAARKQQQQQQQQKAAQLQAQQQAAAAQQNAQQMQSQGGLDTLTSGLGGLALGGRSEAIGGGGAIGAPVNNAGSTAGFDSGFLSALNDSFANMPNNGDNQRSNSYTPQNPYPVPASYPSTPSGIFENPAVFEKLGTDCLFFIFYYSQGTYQQYLAARELKKQSWRFHKKYMTWFQRHEEPKVTTDEYEQGTYVYFDYETGWCTRIKTDFRFEYSFLEDSLQ